MRMWMKEWESVSLVADGLYIWGRKIEISNETNSHKYGAVTAYDISVESERNPSWKPRHSLPRTSLNLVPCLVRRVRSAKCLHSFVQCFNTVTGLPMYLCAV